MKRSPLKDGESVVTAYAEPASGPGWANRPLWVVVRDRAGAIRLECIQPKQFNMAIHTMYGFSAMAHGGLTKEVKRMWGDRT